MATTQKDISTQYAREIIQWMNEELDLSYSTIADAIDADRSTLHRWRSGESAPSKSHYESIMELQRMRTLMDQSFEDIETKRKWLHLPLEGTKGKSTLQHLNDGEIEPIVRVLASGLSGAFA